MDSREIQNRNKKVYVALSGGVDSATAALLLKKKGYTVTGVYMKTWAPPGYPCPWKDEKRDAMRTCAKIGIPFKMWDFTSAYKEKVVDYMVSEYSLGNTPNPDVMCNKEIKFGLFFNRSMEEGADFVATGHYARIKKMDGTYRMFKGKDPNKDQTYFLWTLTQRELSRSLMPIGEFESKKDVRSYAEEHGLPVSGKKDSQGICFIGPIDLNEFLASYIPSDKGPIVSLNGKNLGAHSGLPFYTVGQREGLSLGGSSPYYVARKESSTNTLVVAAPSEEHELMSKECTLENINFILRALNDGETVEVSVRYRQKPISATWQCGILRFDTPARAITKGQSAVIYIGDELIGGGVIKST